MSAIVSHGSLSPANAVDSTLRRIRRLRPRDIVSYLLTYREAGRIAASIDAGALADLETRFGNADPAPGYSKYLDIRYWLHVKLRRACTLGLHRPPRRRVLDLGTGTGYFPFLAMKLGNDAMGIDVGDVPFYDEMVSLLGVERRVWTIHPFESLPDMGRFDLVTAFQICFDRSASGAPWGVAEWDFFLRDVTDHLLAPGGRLVLEFNGLPSADVATFFAGQGARIAHSVISIAKSRN
jgi:SAM-dependent methyltransferase